jgi:hypothetical protein
MLLPEFLNKQSLVRGVEKWSPLAIGPAPELPPHCTATVNWLTTGASRERSGWREETMSRE